MKKIIILIITLMFPFYAFALSPNIVIIPEKPLQGDPVLIKVENVELSKVSSITFNDKKLKPFNFKSVVSAFYGIDLNFKPGEYKIKVNFTDNKEIEKKVTIYKKQKYEVPLGIPEKLGGNSTSSQNNLINTLALENAELNSLSANKKILWKKDFIYPLLNPVITDNYGYTRITGQYSIAHKGVDFRANEKTKVFAINKGIIRLVKTFRNYGKTVVVDHGAGLMSFYMHLSKIDVEEGGFVSAGQSIGYAGQTGYADQPHLHLTIRINNISIDPIKFLDFFKK